MTLVVCLEGKDGLVFASDSRGTFGDPRNVTAQNDTMQKLYKISDYVGVLMSGAGELAVTLIDALKIEVRKNGAVGVTDVMVKFRSVANQKYREWFPDFVAQPTAGNTSPVRPVISAIIGGYDLDTKGKPKDKKIYILSSQLNFAPQRTNYGFAIAGIPQYALYLFNRLYDKGTSTKELAQLAVYSITETASQDGKVGGPVQALEITPVNKAKELSKEEVDRIIKSNSKRSERLKKSFYSYGKTKTKKQKGN